MNFIYEPLTYRVIFGAGTLARAGEELQRIGKRALILSTPEQSGDAAALAERLGASAVGLFTDAVMHVPVSTVDAAAARAFELKADCTVAIGGGSTIGLAKALSLRLDLPSLAIPTTYAGSEVTPIWGMTENGVKTTGRDRRVLPKAVIYDPELTMSLPAAMSIASGLNAIAHSMEGLYAFDGNPIVSLMAEDSIRALAGSLPAIKANPADADARAKALYGCWLAGSVLGAASVALHHKLCHTLGGSFDMPHAQTHTAVLPHAIAYNAPAVPEAMERAARALGGGDPAVRLFELAHGLGAEMSLAKLGMPRDGIETAARLAVANPYPNPRPITEEGITALLERALDGLPPLRS
ncbi:Maleylacetate reductase [Novosphingobium resinovorum]|uniref:Maleylacetate reductase n=1 Tax=Novosphingobium resinovorum TaxID=158500 RepID=A0A031K5S3_9SPHN|nr:MULTISPECIES: maleylacetate reductase [Novosphingobium]EZP83952.1 Maleylacetate reductase [Novosphingobium resinovorum]